MKNYINIFMLSLVSIYTPACGNEIIPVSSEVSGFSQEERNFVENEVKDFIGNCNKYGIECNYSYLSIKIVDSIEDNPNVKGMCTKVLVPNRIQNRVLKQVLLTHGVIEDFSLSARVLIAHELNHCLRNQDHYTKEIDIMSPFILDNKTIEEIGFLNLIKKMFGRK